MKKLIGLVICLVSINSLFAQDAVDLNIVGFTPEVEGSILPGDRVFYSLFENGESSRNVIVKLMAPSGTKRYFGSADIAKDANGHYDFDVKVSIKETSKVKFEGDIVLLISMPTIFGNSVWTKITRTRETLTDPITLDQYTEKADQDYPPRKRLAINCSAIAYDNELKKEVTDNGDTWKNRDKEDYHFFLKNVGDQNWKIDQKMQYGKKSGGDVNASLPYNDELDLDRKIVLRIEITTELGNILWNEVEIESRGLSRFYFGRNYLKAGEEVEEETGNGSSNEDVPDTNNNTTETVDTQDNSSSVNNIDQKGGNTETANKVDNTETSNKVDNSGTSNTTLIKEGASDLTTKTLSAKCATMNAGDSLVNVNGSNVCIQGFKAQGTKSMVGVLALDCNFEIAGTIYPIKGNESITCNKADGKLIEGVLRANTVFNSSVGDVTLKEGTIVKFKGDKLIGASLAENSTITVNGSSFECTANASQDFDIRFDVQGKLVEFTTANLINYTANDLSLQFPAKSRLVYKSGQLNKVFTTATSAFSFGENTINVAASTKGASYTFSDGINLKEVSAGTGNSVSIEGKAISVKEGSIIKFDINAGATEIVKFFVANEITINVYKGKSAKETKVKAGKKVVLENGVVVKAG